MPNVFWDGGNFAAGNGGFITIDGKNVNVSKWSVVFDNITVPVTHSGSKGIVVYRTVGQTAKFHIELNWDFIQRPENIRAYQLGFKFIGYFSAKENMNNTNKGIMCDNVLPQNITLITSSEADDIVRITIDAVANAPVTPVNA